MKLEIIKAFCTRSPCWKANVDKADSRYTKFQQNGPEGGMLHSVGCAQPDASVFVRKWDNENYDKGCAHAVIDANSGVVMQTLKWNYRGWHCGSGSKGSSASCNNTHVGVEMCESKYIKYPASGGVNFEILDKAKAQADCTRAYKSAVQLFAMLALEYHWNPDTDIISHKEGGKAGIASGHVDPEHYWTRLGMPYTMDTFRADVKREMKFQEALNMTEEELEQFVTSIIDKNYPSMWEEQYRHKMDSLADNDCGAWSEKARNWAVENGVIAGIGKFKDGTTNYAWRSFVTREQLVQIEYKLDKLEGGADDA